MAKESRVQSTLGGPKAEKKPEKKSESKSKGKSTDKKTPKSKSKHSVHRMHISRTDNGKFLVDHEFKGGPDQPSIPGESHALNPEELAAHVADHFGVGEGGPGLPAGPAPAAPAPGPEVVPPGPLPTGPTGV
jgi:hypothetical protein